jgi:3',5'-cyclic AMP phosphodiesterase CpdA
MATAQQTIIQFSDLHIVAEDGLLHDKVDSFANIEAALAAVERSGVRPAALLFTGDLSNDGDLNTYRRLRELTETAAERIGSPAYYVMGNHDERSAFRAGLLATEPTTEDYDYVVDLDGLRLIVLDSTVPGDHYGELTDAQVGWLREVLATPAPRGSVLTLHHPPTASPIEMDGVTLNDPERLAEVLDGSDVRIILCGHAHHSSCGSLAGIPVWIANATAYQLDPLAPHVRGIRGGFYTRVDMFETGPVATALPIISATEEILYELTQEEIAAHKAARAAEAAKQVAV